MNIRTVKFADDGMFIVRHDFPTTETCAEYMGIDEADLSWALEEYGRCDGPENVTAWEPYEPDEQWPHDPFAGEEGDDEYHPAETLAKVKAGAELLNTRRIK